MKKSKIHGLPWDFSSMFNEVVRSMPERPMQKRDYLWASELQADAYSRYLRMWAHPMTNPPNLRSRKKFIMGHIMEWIVGVILTMTGLLKAKQLYGTVELPGKLKVVGKLDFVAGGTVDWDKAKEEVKRLREVFSITMDDMPPIINYAVDKILARMEMIFSRVLMREYIFECKSVSGFIMETILRSNKPRPRHVLQPLHYLLANPDIAEAQLAYISKDDAQMHSFVVAPTRELLKIYHDDVQMMTDYYRNSGKNYMKNLPPKENEVVFYDDTFTFQKNYNVQWSNYLTLGWGYKDFDEFNTRWTKPLASYNRVFKRCVKKENMTKANIEIIGEASKTFPDWDKYVLQARKAGAFEKPEENEEDE